MVKDLRSNNQELKVRKEQMNDTSEDEPLLIRRDSLLVLGVQWLARKLLAGHGSQCWAVGRKLADWKKVI